MYVKEMTQFRRLFLSNSTYNVQNDIFKSNWQLCLNQISKDQTGELHFQIIDNV